MRMLALAILAIGTVLATGHAQAQAWDPNYPVCIQVFGRFNSLAVAIEEAQAEHLLQVRNRFGNVGLRGVQVSRRLPHAAGLHDGHEDMEVLQLKPPADAIAHSHDFTHIGIHMRPSNNSIM